MGKRFNKFLGNLKVTFKVMGSTAGQTLAGLEKADKEINDKIKEITAKVHV